MRSVDWNHMSVCLQSHTPSEIISILPKKSSSSRWSLSHTLPVVPLSHSPCPPFWLPVVTGTFITPQLSLDFLVLQVIQLYAAHAHSDCLGLHLFYLYRWFISFLRWVEFHGMSIHHFLFSYWLTVVWWLILCVNLVESMCNQLAVKILFLLCLKAVSRGD